MLFFQCNPDFYPKGWVRNEALVIPPKIKELRYACLTSYFKNPIQKIIMVGVESIEGYAFTHWDNLKEVVLGRNLRTIDHNSFDACFNIEKVYVPNDRVAELIVDTRILLLPDSAKIINSNTQEEYK